MKKLFMTLVALLTLACFVIPAQQVEAKTEIRLPDGTVIIIDDDDNTTEQPTTEQTTEDKDNADQKPVNKSTGMAAKAKKKAEADFKDCGWSLSWKQLSETDTSAKAQVTLTGKRANVNVSGKEWSYVFTQTYKKASNGKYTCKYTNGKTTYKVKDVRRWIANINTAQKKAKTKAMKSFNGYKGWKITKYSIEDYKNGKIVAKIHAESKAWKGSTKRWVYDIKQVTSRKSDGSFSHKFYVKKTKYSVEAIRRSMAECANKKP